MSEEEKRENAEDQPHIQVDEDWKKTVAEEKERLKEQEAPAPETGGEQEAAATGTGAEEHAPRRTGPLPAPDVGTFISGLYMQTLAALGAIENPITGERERNPEEAAYMIDTIGMLKEKMRGNLTGDEEAYLQNILTDLRMRYVEVSKSG